MRWIPAWLVVLVLVPAPSARGETFQLVNGGQVEGKLLNPDETPRVQYVIQTAAGGRITLAAAQVIQLVHHSPAEVEYETIRPQYPDTVKGQWELSEWCREHYLYDARKTHLQRILELDSEHEQSRRALGYSRIDGRWKTQDDVMTERGYVNYKGNWRLPQEIELMERRRKQELAEKAWFANLKRWREWLDGEKRQTAITSFAQIKDASAVAALKVYLADEPMEPVRKLYIETLANIATPSAIDVLAKQSIDDPVQEVRLTCLDFLAAQPRPAVVEFYIQELRSKDNSRVNRAAVGLARMKDPMAIAPLVDALVTTHKFKLTTGSPGGYSATFTPSGGIGPGGSSGSGLSAGTKTQIISREFRNPAVLDALVVLAGGVNYSYDLDSWKRWLAARKTSQVLDARRDSQ